MGSLADRIGTSQVSMHRSSALADPDGSGWEIALGLFPEPVVGLRITEEGAERSSLLRLTPNRAAELADVLARNAERLGGSVA